MTIRRAKSAFALIAIAIILPCAFANAETETLSFGLKIWYPDTWQKVYEADRLLVRSPDGSAIAMFCVLKAEDAAKAQMMMNMELARIFYNIEIVTQPMSSKINNLDGIVLDGTGIVGGIYVIWVARMVIYKKKALLVLGCSEPAQFTVNSDTIRKIVESIKEV